MQAQACELSHPRIHLLSPLRTPHSHCKDDGATRETDKAQDCEQPAITNGIDDRCSDQGPDARKDVSHEVVQCNTLGGFLRHKFGQHRCHHAENEHRSNAEEEVCDHLTKSVIRIREIVGRENAYRN